MRWDSELSFAGGLISTPKCERAPKAQNTQQSERESEESESHSRSDERHKETFRESENVVVLSHDKQGVQA